MASCSQNEEPSFIHQNQSDFNPGHLRSEIEAIELAKQVIEDYEGEDYAPLSRAMSSIEVDTYTDGNMTNEADSNSVYVVNFKEGGFALVSANPDITMPFGFSDKGSFEVNTSDGGLSEYILQSCSAASGFIRFPIDSILRPIEPAPFPGSPETYMIVTHGDHECHRVPTATNVYGNKTQYLLTTNWDQWPPFNNSVVQDFNKPFPAGCVPVAMGQIMAYHRKPSSYGNETFNWSLMLTTPTYSWIDDPGCRDVAYLLRWLGKKLSAEYSLGGTSAFDHDAAWLFRELGYSNANLTAYSYTTVVNEINNGRPVYVSGARPNATTGHAWVVDGYYYVVNTIDYYHVNTVKHCSTVYERTNYAHCNWGWKGDKNGFYQSDIFHISNEQEYSQYLNMITNIY